MKNFKFLFVCMMFLLVAIAASKSFANSEATAAVQQCDDSKSIYRFCENQNSVYEKAIASAKTNSKSVLIVFGADWCGWCHSLHKLLVEDKIAESFSNSLDIIEIAVEYFGLNEQGQEDSIHTQGSKELFTKLADLAAAVDGEKPQLAYPLLAMVNPQNNKVTFLSTGLLEDNTMEGKKVIKVGHSPEKIVAAIKNLLEKVK